MRFIDGNVINIALRYNKNKIYYFDEGGIYRSVSFEEAERKGVKNMERICYGRNGTLIALAYLRNKVKEERLDNLTLLEKIVVKLKEGDTIDTFESYLESTELEQHEKPSGLARFVTRINNPEFLREPENENPNTFDFVYVEVNIVRDWEEDRFSYINKNKKQIFELVLNKLERSKSFQKFGVPINFLKVSKITLRRDSVLEFVLELKEF